MIVHLNQYVDVLFQLIGLLLFVGGIVVKVDVLKNILNGLVDLLSPRISAIASGASILDPGNHTGTTITSSHTSLFT